jgi:FKBP-type peptidyl-prolyl cis-trans isomerase
VIECWDEGFKQMEIGSKATLDCPASMAYGDVMKPGIPENSDLIFDVELLACENDEMPSLDMTQM